MKNQNQFEKRETHDWIPIPYKDILMYKCPTCGIITCFPYDKCSSCGAIRIKK